MISLQRDNGDTDCLENQRMSLALLTIEQVEAIHGIFCNPSILPCNARANTPARAVTWQAGTRALNQSSCATRCATSQTPANIPRTTMACDRRVRFSFRKEGTKKNLDPMTNPRKWFAGLTLFFLPHGSPLGCRKWQSTPRTGTSELFSFFFSRSCATGSFVWGYWTDSSKMGLCWRLELRRAWGKRCYRQEKIRLWRFSV